jgi:hypothetical protein
MRITPAMINPGTLVVTGEIPSVSVGRQVSATVMSMPKNGLVLVSMFGRQFMVETNLDLKMGQVLNLKVYATSPKIILKPVDNAVESRPLLKALDTIVEQLVGKLGDVPIKSFDVREILKKIVSESQEKDALPVQIAQKFVEQFSQIPNAVAFLIIPFVDDESKGRAQVSIEREDSDYRINFQMETDSLGLLESTVLRSAQGLSVELRSGSEEIADFLRSHIQDLFDSLEPLGVKSIEVVRKNLLPPQQPGVNVVV